MSDMYDFGVGPNGFLDWQNVDSGDYDEVELCDEGTDLDKLIEEAEWWIVHHFTIPADQLIWSRRPDGTARCRAEAGTPTPSNNEILLQAANDHLMQDLLETRRRHDPACCSHCGGKFETNGGGTGGLCAYCQDAQIRADDKERALPHPA